MTTTEKTKTPPSEEKGLVTRANTDLLGQMDAADNLQAQVFLPRSFAEVLEMAKLMASCGGAVRPHLRNKPGDCLAIIMQSLRWRMDPFAVANKTYFVNDQLAYEAQLVNAVVNQSKVLNGRLHIEWEGDGQTLHCRVTGYVKGDDRPKVVSQAIAPIRVKNSPLWKDAPQQQLAYYTTRMWARLYVPEVLLGVYTSDEVQELVEDRDQTVIAPARPKRADYEAFAASVTKEGLLADSNTESAGAPPSASERPLPGSQASAEGSAPAEPSGDWDCIDNDGEVICCGSPEAMTNAMVRLIEKARNPKAVLGLIDSNMVVLGKLPEDLERRINEAVADRQEALQGRA